MSPVYDLYGVRSASFDAARASVERAIGVELIRHDSDYLGEYFLAGAVDGEHFQLQRNYHVGEEEWLEPDHRDTPYLLYVNNAAAPERTRALLERQPSIRRLRHTEV